MWDFFIRGFSANTNSHYLCVPVTLIKLNNFLEASVKLMSTFSPKISFPDSESRENVKNKAEDKLSLQKLKRVTKISDFFNLRLKNVTL